ncbi:M16 family metallopeptidase [Hymenobacter siberiensis]|uniref:M16 family metallopeptidase n=1 Tax=Hymenobacter siberiensis TaxID=2848396 RepID=UPI001D01FD05|nr:pitrilysin family protein [Hymenobacter siberiensis]
MNLRFLSTLGLALMTSVSFAQQKPATKAPAAKTALATLPSGTKLIEKVTKQPGQLVIPYEKYVLPNGLTLVVAEDHSDPLVHVDVTYHVGSAREQIGKSGFAHFFEHMMFQGSDHVGDQQHFKLVTAAGGTLNGSTTTDRTNYFETLPSNQLETGLWLEADRMGFLLDAVSQKKFEIQRSTVKNERGQRVDNTPYGQSQEYLIRTMFPYGHPYSWSPIGYLEDLDRSDVNDLKNFFLRWYGPNNATLTVGGDVKPAEVVKMVEKYFGPIKRGPAVPVQKLPAPVLAQDRYVSYSDNIRFPMLQMWFPTVPQGHPDAVALDALADILGGGKTSLLYKNLVKNQKTVQAQAYQQNYELAGALTITALPLPGKALDSTEYIIRNTLKEFETRGVNDGDVQRFKAQTEAQVINALASVQGKVSLLAANQTFYGNPNYLTVEMKELKALTKADVQRVYDKYVRGKHAVILSVLPKTGGVAAAKPDNFTVDKSGYKAPDYGYAGLKYVKPIDTFDRSKQPAAGANPVVKVPALYQETLPNGLKIVGTKNTEIPAITMRLTIRGGHRLEQAMPAKAGLAQLTASMLNEGSEKYTGEQFTTELDKLGSRVLVNAGDNETTVYVQSLTKNLPATMALLEQRLLHPRFDAADFARVKKQQIELIANFANQPAVVADLTYNRLVYGSNNIAGTAVAGTTTSVGSIALDDVKSFYNTYYAPNVSYLVAVGDVDQATLDKQLGFLKNWAKKDVTIPADMAGVQPDKTTVYFVNKPGAAQSEIRVGYLTDMKYDATGAYYKAGLANFLLGGAFNSRINLNLRENKGYTYGANSGFRGTRYAGPFTAQAGVRADATAASVKEFMSEIQNYQNGISDEELAFLQTSVGQSDALKYETGQQKAGFLSRLVEYDLQPTYVNQQTDILKNLKKEDVQAIAKQYLPADKMYIVVVGDDKQLPTLQALGYPVVQLDMEGKPVAAEIMKMPMPAPTQMAAPTDEKMKKQFDDGGKIKTKTKKGKN